MDGVLKFYTDSCGHLLCPLCQCDNMHQYRVTYYVRERGEDTPSVKHTFAARAFDGEEDHGNPSPRRDAAAVRFFCEHCDELFEMCFGQHKGRTQVSARIVGKRTGPW